ncbi:hypothetical protein WDU94_004786 [Cyamophila willieti]
MATVTIEDVKENYIGDSENIIEDVIEYVTEEVLEMENEDIPGNNNLVVLAKSDNNDSTQDWPVIIVTSSLNLNEPQIINNVQFAIDKSREFLIARNKEAAIDIKHEAISRNHCVISFKENQAFVKNMSSVGMSVNNVCIKNKNQTCALNNGDEIILSKYLPEFVMKFYENASHIPAKEMKILTENLSILNKKRKKEDTLDSENVGDAKRCRQHCQNKRQELQQEKIDLETSFSQRMSNARKSYDSQMQDIHSNRTVQLTDEHIKRIKEELEQKFEAEKKMIKSEYTRQMEKWKSEIDAENEKLKLEMETEKNKLKIDMESETKKLLNQVTATSEELNMKVKENEELKDKLKIAEELIQIGQQELIRESESKREIIEQAKQELEEAQKSKQEALKKCLENENMKNYLAESNEKLKSCYEQKIEALYGTKLDLEKEIEVKLKEKTSESEGIINQLSSELDSVRELLTIHENERQVLESEVQTKISDFAEVLESEAQCTICSEIFVNAVTLLGCMHTFCEYCITAWKKQKQECPICRHKITKNQEKRNILIDSWIASFIEKMSPAVKSNRQEVIAIRAQQAQSKTS